MEVQPLPRSLSTNGRILRKHKVTKNRRTGRIYPEGQRISRTPGAFAQAYEKWLCLPVGAGWLSERLRRAKKRNWRLAQLGKQTWI